MPPFGRRYTDEQKDAATSAVIDRGIRPAARVCELARRGELEPGLAPFEMPVATLRDAVHRERQRRRKRAVQAQPENASAAIDLIRHELIVAAREEVAIVRRLQRAEDPADAAASKRRAERLRAAARALREAAAIPDSNAPRPSPGVKPGQRDPAQDGAHTPGAAAAPSTLAGAILAAHHGAPSMDTAHTHIGETAADDAPPLPSTQGETGSAGAQTGAGQLGERTGDGPGSAERAEVARAVLDAAAAQGYVAGT